MHPSTVQQAFLYIFFVLNAGTMKKQSIQGGALGEVSGWHRGKGGVVCVYLYARVEEAQREQELLVHRRVGGDVELAVVQLVVRALQVRLILFTGKEGHSRSFSSTMLHMILDPAIRENGIRKTSKFLPTLLCPLLTLWGQYQL